MPNRIREQEFRSELCFMEGIRPKKTIAVAERFIQTHLGLGLDTKRRVGGFAGQFLKRKE